MTENKRYSDGSLAKWYYSRDYAGIRVISNGVDEFTLNSKKQFKDINSKELKGTNQLLDELNKLEDKIIILEKENKDLKIKNKGLQSELQIFKEDVTQSTKIINELNDENKELRLIINGLKQQNQKLKGRLNDLGVEYYD